MTVRPYTVVYARSDCIRLYIDGFIISAALPWTFGGPVAMRIFIHQNYGTAKEKLSINTKRKS